ncbi:MAG: HAMP domain-containing histidine kinase [Deltaproteobacteria bacterium]|nr:HAMP domain-containing histidine kinase [Deltaproteobacteria bacterium]
MTPGKLYIKILLSFLAVFFTALIVIFALFLALPGKHFTAHLEESTRTKALIIKKVVEDKIHSEPVADWHKNEQLKNFILDFGSVLGARLWLQKPDGTILLKSFPGEIPDLVSRLRKKPSLTRGNITIYRQRDLDYYAVMPIAFGGGETGHIHVLFDRPQGPPRPKQGFALGLFIIGLVAALLILPVSRIITSRLEKLRQSALTITEGDLSCRADVRGKDEIGDLAQAFNRMADKLGTMIGNARELMAHVSHELRTPLTRIRISEEMLREKLEQGEAAFYERHLDEIREDIQELDHLIGRILELSKLDMQGAPLIFAPFDPSEVIRELLRRFQPVIQKKDLRVVSDISLLPTFFGDKEALTTVFLNLLDNAVKFTPEKGQIHILSKQSPGFLEISITNTFEELPESELSRIFDPFHRAKQSKAAGSGLGLAIAKKIIERHGGTIGAYNLEKGLEIKISLPDQKG